MDLLGLQLYGDGASCGFFKLCTQTYIYIIQAAVSPPLNMLLSKSWISLDSSSTEMAPAAASSSSAHRLTYTVYRQRSSPPPEHVVVKVIDLLAPAQSMVITLAAASSSSNTDLYTVRLLYTDDGLAPSVFWQAWWQVVSKESDKNSMLYLKFNFHNCFISQQVCSRYIKKDIIREASPYISDILYLLNRASLSSDWFRLYLVTYKR